jgi:hypothetical protein
MSCSVPVRTFAFFAALREILPLSEQLLAAMGLWMRR